MWSLYFDELPEISDEDREAMQDAAEEFYKDLSHEAGQQRAAEAALLAEAHTEQGGGFDECPW